MEEKQTISKKLSDLFNMHNDELQTQVNEVIDYQPLTNNEKTIDFAKQSNEKANADFETIRSNLFDIIEKGNEAIDGILNVAKEGDSPRAYEVVSQLIKSVADANKDLLQLHKQLKDIHLKQTESNQSAQNITNQSIFVGSTTELQNLVKGIGSQSENNQ